MMNYCKIISKFIQFFFFIISVFQNNQKVFIHNLFQIFIELFFYRNSFDKIYIFFFQIFLTFYSYFQQFLKFLIDFLALNLPCSVLMIGEIVCDYTDRLLYVRNNLTCFLKCFHNLCEMFFSSLSLYLESTKSTFYKEVYVALIKVKKICRVNIKKCYVYQEIFLFQLKNLDLWTYAFFKIHNTFNSFVYIRLY